MKYEIIEVQDGIDKIVSQHVVVTNEDGSMESFPVDENNPRYIQWLAEQDEVTE